jgi:uncharacterized SAM-dependent methyltransferase
LQGPCDDGFLREVLTGLTAPRKTLPCKYFYDKRGSKLFDRICLTDEYYPTRCEREILYRERQAIAALTGPDAVLVDLGGCNPEKASILLGALAQPKAYVPVDVSVEALAAGSAHVAAAFPQVMVEPLAADFTRVLALPQVARRAA